jgi:ferrous iron transport protein A
MLDKRGPAQDIDLASLKKGQAAIISGLAETFQGSEQAVLQTRLRELGFVAGEKVRIVAESFPGRDPIAVRIGNTTFALRRHEAAMVRVVRPAD